MKKPELEKKCKVNGKEEYWCDECDTHKQPLFVCNLLKEQRKADIEMFEKMIDNLYKEFNEILMYQSKEKRNLQLYVDYSILKDFALKLEKQKSKLKELEK